MNTDPDRLFLKFQVKDDKGSCRSVVFPLPRGCGRDYAKQLIDRALQDIRVNALEMHDAFTEGRKPQLS